MNISDQMTHLGWRPHFQTQLQLEELENHIFGKIVEQHHSEYIIQLVEQQFSLAITDELPPMCVGDWLIFKENFQFVRLLESFSSFSRNTSGANGEVQIVAANVDTVFIVSSLDKEFNLQTIERFLSLAHEAEVQAVVVLTKKDLCENWEDYVEKVQSLDSLLMIEVVNALDKKTMRGLLAWCDAGQTIACLGAAGVGKSTLINTLGELTTSSKNSAGSLFQLPAGFWLMDTVGMRELQLQQSENDTSQNFSDIELLAQKCRFSDCSHNNEPGCKVKAALANHSLDKKRFNDYKNLLNKQARNLEAPEEERSSGKKTIKPHKTMQRELRNQKEKDI